jgi:murein DD-endopeptidase MepM/ murein hydrolase activator NlpD
VEKKPLKQKLKRKLTHQYRLVMLNEETFEERFSLKLNRLNVFVLGGLFSIFLIVGTILLIAYTPLKEYIPGYDSTKLRTQALKATLKADSISRELTNLKLFTQAIQPILTGNIQPDKIDSIQQETRNLIINDSLLKASKEDSIFREKIESQDRFPIVDTKNILLENVFFAPLSGMVSQDFDSNSKHFAIDIVAKTGTPVKSVADGTVIFSEWTTGTGYVIIVKHENNFVSVYKHNGTLLKEQGDFVNSGEVIATVGSTGELTTGPHLHFELWSGGYPVNPTTFIDFN